MTALIVPVYVESWQHECCGENIEVGSAAAWRLVLRPDAWWLGVDLAAEMVALSAVASREWVELGHAAGTTPVVATAGGLTVFLADGAALGAGPLRGGLQEDRHVDVPTALPQTRGVVRRLRLVSRWYRTNGRELIAQPNRVRLDDLDRVGRELPGVDPGDEPFLQRQVDGLLVDLEVPR